jgi:hypothetical protein
MNKLIAILSYALSLYGCELGANTAIQQRSVDGETVLQSRVVSRPGLLRFDCLRSVSGRCHYTVYARDCSEAAGAPAGRACAGQPVERFTLASGRSRQVARPGTFRSCVSAGPDAPAPECDGLDPMAAR